MLDRSRTFHLRDGDGLAGIDYYVRVDFPSFAKVSGSPGRVVDILCVRQFRNSLGSLAFGSGEIFGRDGSGLRIRKP